MYLSTIFKFSEPLCLCPEENISWTVSQGISVTFKCKTCGVSLFVPNEKWLAQMNFDKPYPGKPPPKEKEMIELPHGISVLPGGRYNYTAGAPHVQFPMIWSDLRSMTGDKIAALGISEPDAGSDVAKITTTARRDGE